MQLNTIVLSSRTNTFCYDKVALDHTTPGLEIIYFGDFYN